MSGRRFESDAVGWVYGIYRQLLLRERKGRAPSSCQNGSLFLVLYKLDS